MVELLCKQRISEVCDCGFKQLKKSPSNHLRSVLVPSVRPNFLYSYKTQSGIYENGKVLSLGRLAFNQATYWIWRLHIFASKLQLGHWQFQNLLQKNTHTDGLSRRGRRIPTSSVRLAMGKQTNVRGAWSAADVASPHHCPSCSNSRDRWIMRLCARIILRIIGDLPHNCANPA